MPTPGSWGAALLLDGNVGIGGDPERLRRIGDLLRFDGEILAEADRCPASGLASKSCSSSTAGP